MSDCTVPWSPYTSPGSTCALALKNGLWYADTNGIPRCFVIYLLSPAKLICTCFMAITPSATYLPHECINKEDALINYGLEGLFLFARLCLSSERPLPHQKVHLLRTACSSMKWCSPVPPGARWATPRAKWRDSQGEEFTSPVGTWQWLVERASVRLANCRKVSA